jgi:hypothetical protein
VERIFTSVKMGDGKGDILREENKMEKSSMAMFIVKVIKQFRIS